MCFNAICVLLGWTHRCSAQWWNWFPFVFDRTLVSEGTECGEWRAASTCVPHSTHLWPNAKNCWREVNIRRVAARVQSREQVFSLSRLLKCDRSGVDFMVSAKRICRMNCSLHTNTGHRTRDHCATETKCRK